MTEFKLPLNKMNTFYKTHKKNVSSSDRRKKMRTWMHPELESGIIKLVKSTRSLRFPVTGMVIQMKEPRIYLRLQFKHYRTQNILLTTGETGPARKTARDCNAHGRTQLERDTAGNFRNHRWMSGRHSVAWRVCFEWSPYFPTIFTTTAMWHLSSPDYL